MTRKFKGQKIKKVRDPVQKKGLRLTLLSTNYFHTHTVDKNSIVGYVLSPNSKLIIHKHAKKKKKQQDTERLRTENVELEKILAADVDRQADG